MWFYVCRTYHEDCLGNKTERIKPGMDTNEGPLEVL